MSDFGALFRADDGSLLVTSDTPCYEFAGEISPASRVGNVSTYSVNTSVFPLVFVKCGIGGSGGVLAIEGSASAWTVTVLASVYCNILVFIPLASASQTGTGVIIYDANARPVFDSSKKILNARKVALLSEGASFGSPAGTNMVGYTCGPVKPNKTVYDQWVTVEAYAYIDTQFVCTTTLEQSCTTRYDYDFATSSFVEVTTCNWLPVQNCTWVNIQNYAQIDALVRTTTWSIERAAAKIENNYSISFQWIVHQSGYYKEIIQYQTTGYSLSMSSGFVPPGYIPPISFLNSAQSYEGQLTKDNTFPYTTTRANTNALSCITGVSSDYD